MWTVYKGENEEHMEVLVRDIKGGTIQITIMQDDIAQWKSILAEGKTYYLRNFKVHNNDTSYKMSSHKFRLTIVGATRVDAFDISGIPKSLLKFKDFAEILDGKFVPDILVGNVKHIIVVLCTTMRIDATMATMLMRMLF
ncbi:hypothetical protein P8452_39705 [Trifolium repens]|nr:hypothetical protein P8452_39705 [Trifolium repens]